MLKFSLRDFTARYPYTSVAATLLLLLVPSFMITLWRPSLEPYPALVLPGGAYVSSHDSEFYRYNTTELLAVPLSSENFETVNLLATFPRFDATRISVMLRRDLQLNDKTSAEEQAEIRKWIAERLAKNGYRTARIKIVRKTVSVSLSDGRSTDDQVTYERIIDLS